MRRSRRDSKKRDRVEVKPTGLPVRDSRVESARAALAKYMPIMDENHILDVIAEIGLWDCWKGYNKNATGLVFDFTDLQMCSFAAAIVCAGELAEQAQ